MSDDNKAPGPPCGPDPHPTLNCPDHDPATEVCLSTFCATQDPPPASHQERVLTSTLYVGPGKLEGLYRRTGWAPGLYGFGTQVADGSADFVGWFRCVTAPDGAPPTFEDAGLGPGIGSRPFLTYRAGQPRAHGILKERGHLVGVTLIVRHEGKQIARYEWDGSAVNFEREYVLRRVGNNEPLARACPVTRAVWVDEPHPEGSEIHAEYTVVPLPESPRDATDAIQEILTPSSGSPGKSVVLPPGTYYVRTHYDGDLGPSSVGLKIPAGLHIRGQALQPGETYDEMFDRAPVLRALPRLQGDPGDLDSPSPALTLGTMILRAQEGNVNPQQGAGLKFLVVHGALDGTDLLALTGQPTKSHHGAQFEAVTDLRCQGVRFTGCFDDGLKLDRRKYKFDQLGRELVVASDGRTFEMPDLLEGGPAAPIEEGLVKIEQDPNVSTPAFIITIPAGAPFGNGTDPKPLEQDLKLYAANATRNRAGLAPIGFLTNPNVSNDPNLLRFGPPLNAYVDGDDAEPAFNAAIGWLDTLDGTGYFCESWRLPTGNDLPAGTAVLVDYAAARITSNDTPSIESCDFDQNGRNGYTHASNVREGYFVNLRVRGNARLDAAIGLEGAVAADLQLGTTARNDFEVWEDITARDIHIEGSLSSAFKIGAEPGPEYAVGFGIYTGVRMRSCARRGLKTAGRECGPLEFDDFEATDCGEIAVSIGHGNGTYASGMRFGNRKPPAASPPGDLCTPDFDESASSADLIVTGNAYAPSKYYDAQPPVRHEFRDMEGILPDQQAYVIIGAPGVIVRGATNVHFVVRTTGSAPLPPCTVDLRPDPPVELWGPFPGCTFDLEPGTLFDGVVDGGPVCPGNSEA